MAVQISWLLGVEAFSAMALLIYIVICEIFPGHDGRTETMLLGSKPKETNRSGFAVFLPIAEGVVLAGLYIMICFFTYEGKMPTPLNGAVFSLFKAVDFHNPISLVGCLLSLIFFAGGSILAWAIGNNRIIPEKKQKKDGRLRIDESKKWVLLYCLNPWAVLMVVPGIFSAAVFFLSVINYSVLKKKYWLTAVGAVLLIAVHFPYNGISANEVFALVYTMLIPVLAGVKNKTMQTVTGVLAVLCGMMPVLILCIVRA